MAKLKKRKSTKLTKPRVAKTTKRKSTTRKRRSGSPFEIDRVPTLI